MFESALVLSKTIFFLSDVVRVTDANAVVIMTIVVTLGVVTNIAVIIVAAILVDILVHVITSDIIVGVVFITPTFVMYVATDVVVFTATVASAASENTT